MLSSEPPSKFLKIVLFVKKWPQKSHARGLERHALTLHPALAKRGHDLHKFTTSTNSSFSNYSINNLRFHFSKPTPAGYLDQALNSLEPPKKPQTKALTERAVKVVEEVKFFSYYAHHVATSDHAGDILKRVYMIPKERVHIILNGVAQHVFRPDVSKGKDFKKRHGIPDSKSLVIGLAGRLVKDKGHPLMFEALKQTIEENSTFQDCSMVVVAGDGPWGARYRDLGENILVLGPLEQAELASFYNAIDIFVNPTLRAQGSVIVSNEMGCAFSPTASALKKAIYELWVSGREVIDKKGQVAMQRGLQLFTATKMVAAYERLFLCMSSVNHEEHFCEYQP
ncbi:putative glycosyltransferase EpsF [Glycine max]|nr:putative glycosyltransferase EpsF [Glycine max]